MKYLSYLWIITLLAVIQSSVKVDAKWAKILDQTNQNNTYDMQKYPYVYRAKLNMRK